MPPPATRRRATAAVPPLARRLSDCQSAGNLKVWPVAALKAALLIVHIFRSEGDGNAIFRPGLGRGGKKP